MAAAPQAHVIVFPGSNGERDLSEALQRVGFAVAYHPASEPLPATCQLAALPGGFSYGDYWRAGTLASQAPAVRAIPSLVAGGGLVIGICNGFQILVEAGLLPGALTDNDPPGFLHRWVTLRSDALHCPWTTGVAAGTLLRMPMAHAEGNYVAPTSPPAQGLRAPFRYTENPNGSDADVAALVDSTGHILGIMPHPERASEPDLGCTDGTRIFAAAYTYLQGVDA